MAVLKKAKSIRGKDINDVLRKFTKWLIEHPHITIDFKNLNYQHNIEKYEASKISFTYYNIKDTNDETPNYY